MHPRVQFLLHASQAILLLGITGTISRFHRIVGQVVQFILLAIDAMKLPWPVVPRRVAVGRFIGKLREFIDVLADSMLVVGQRRFSLLFFQDGFLNVVAPRCLAPLEVVPETHRLATSVVLTRDDAANVDSI